MYRFNAFCKGDVAPYLTGSFINGKPLTSQVIHLHSFALQVVFSAGLIGSVGKSLIAATAQTDFDIQKNGVSIGTIRFASGSTIPSFIMANTTTFDIGDYMMVIAPAVPDATLADITFALMGKR
jgi:hypothetical protein